MGKNFHTVIVVPNARARLRKWRVSNVQITVVLSLFLLLTLAAAFFTWGYFTQTVDSAEIARLRKENQDLRSVNTTFETDVRHLQEKLADYEDRTMELAIVAGLDPEADGGEAGVGGSSADDSPAGLDHLTARADRLGGTLDQVESQLHKQMDLISATPAITPAKGILTSGFGVRRDPITHNRAFHAGLDIGAAPGAPVHATADGVVTRAGRSGGLGKAVYLSHGFGVSTRYGHMSKLAVKAGQRVHRGEVIGYVGSTGRSTGYHLHYEVHVDGKAVNPLAYLLDQTLQ